MIAIRSATFSTSPRSWLVSRTVTPSSRRRPISPRVAARASTSIPAVGSSRATSAGLPDERERETEPLPLAARQPAEARPGGGARQAHQREQLIGVARRGVEPAVEPEHLAGGHPRIDPAAALEHQPDARPVIPPGPGRIHAQHADAAAIGSAVALDDLDRRRLARAVRAEQGERLAAVDPERQRRARRLGRRTPS